MRTLSRGRSRPSTSDTAVARLRALLGDEGRTGPAAGLSEVDALRPSSPAEPPAWDEPGRPGRAGRQHAARLPPVDPAADRPGPAVSTMDELEPDGGSRRRRRAGSALSSRGARLVDRWVPAGLRGARVDPGRRGAVALVAVLVLSVALVSVLVWRSRPQPEPVRPPPVLVPAATAPGGPSAGPGPSIVVAVTGRVRRPGVVTVPAGARVIDALRAAGGPLPGADLALLNLARRLADGELVVVGVPGAATGAAGAGDASGPAGPGAGGAVNLNTATLEQLDGLPGVGPVLAQRILDWRAANGPFTSVDQLRDVAGIGESKLAQIRDRVTV